MSRLARKRRAATRSESASRNPVSCSLLNGTRGAGWLLPTSGGFAADDERASLADDMTTRGRRGAMAMDFGSFEATSGAWGLNFSATDIDHVGGAAFL